VECAKYEKAKLAFTYWWDGVVPVFVIAFAIYDSNGSI
jgi:hypothetical protein